MTNENTHLDISSLKDGYTAKQAYAIHQDCSAEKFVNITEAGAYYYLHLPEFIPHTAIQKDGVTASLEAKEQSEIGKLSLPLENKDTCGEKVSFQEMIFAKDSPLQGVIIIHKGQIVYEKYPGMNKNDYHVWMSNSKVITSLLLVQLEEEGLVNVHDEVVKYLPRAKGSAWEHIKIIDVLNMQTGLDLEESPQSRANKTSYLTKFFAREVGSAIENGEKLNATDFLFSIPKLHEAGVAFEYSSINTQLLGLIIENVTNKTLGRLITERIWSKTAMDGDAMLGLTPQGTGIIHGLLSSRLVDMAKFAMLYTPSWHKVSSTQIVSTSAIEKIQTGGNATHFMKGSIGPRLVANFREQPLFNSYQWDSVFDDGDFYKSGLNGQGLYISPKNDAVVAWFATGFAKVPMEAFARSIVKQVLQ